MSLASVQLIYVRCVEPHSVPNAVHLTVRGLVEVLAPFGCELVEPPAAHPKPFDKFRANGIYVSEQY